MAADLGSIGLTRAREKALQTLAVAMQEGRLAFSAHTPRQHHQKPLRAAGYRPMDGALHRHAWLS
jgi:hypothetical protein